MSWIGIGRGIAKTAEGFIEGDMAKVGKGIFKTVRSSVFTLIGAKANDGEDGNEMLDD